MKRLKLQSWNTIRPRLVFFSMFWSCVCGLIVTIDWLRWSAIDAHAAPAAVAVEQRPPTGIVLPVRIAGVVDGDTVECEVVWKIRVRMIDCWAPESRTTDVAEKQLGLKAKLNLAAMAINKPATLFVPTDGIKQLGDITSLSRVLGRLWLEGEDRTLSARQVQGGFASSTKGGALGK